LATNWFDIVNGQDLEQGDLIANFSVVRPLIADVITDPENIPLEIVRTNLIVLTQSCDLVTGREKIHDVILCEVVSLDEAKSVAGHVLAKKGNPENLVRYSLVGFHPLPQFESDLLLLPFSVVHFNSVHTVPINIIRDVAKNNGQRLRLRTPYREHMSQRFGFMFSRIGLPDDLRLPS
jgi:hypothetical protein